MMKRLSVEDVESSERGAVLVIGAGALVALLVVAALVVDLGLARSDQARNRAVADAIATAGALGLSEGGGIGGCESAAGYAAELIGPASGLACASFPVSCDNSTPPVSTTSTIDGVTTTLTYPVLDSDPMMTPTSGGAQTIGAADGDRCGRFGVAVRQERAAMFSAVFDGDSLHTAAHSVALVSDPDGSAEIVNLLLIEPHQCPALSVGGGGAVGGVYVESSIDPVTGDQHPGRISIDSDGTVGCGATISTTGNHANVHAQGPPGCSTELLIGTGWGCGVIETVAPGGPGCSAPACSGAPGTISPSPVTSRPPRTRAPFDWRYNCKPTYPASFGISACPDAASGSAYIDNLVAGAQATGGFQFYSASYDCSVKPSDDIVVPLGNWFIDCYPLSVKGKLTFEGGNLIVDEDITLASLGVLNVNTNNSDTAYNWSQGSPTQLAEHSDGAAFVYFKDGHLNKSGGASLNLHHTMVYFSETSGLDMTGGSGAGAMTWTAPIEGPFKDLALWSDSSSTHKLAGSVSLALEGVVFAPQADFSFRGNGSISTVEAQFVAKSLTTVGNGALRIAPIFQRSITHPPLNIAALIR